MLHRVWPENPTLALRRPSTVSGGCATRRYVVGRIPLGFGVHNRAVHFGLSRGILVEGACARAFFSTALAGELVTQAQSAGALAHDLIAQAGHGNSSSTCRPGAVGANLSRASEVADFWTDELVSQSLMIALAVIMSNEVLNGFPQRLLAEEDHAIQA